MVGAAEGRSGLHASTEPTPLSPSGREAGHNLERLGAAWTRKTQRAACEILEKLRYCDDESLHLHRYDLHPLKRTRCALVMYFANTSR
jgi:hypothetical protein